MHGPPGSRNGGLELLGMFIATVGPAKRTDAGLTIGCGGKGEGERPQTCAAARLIGLMDPSGKRKLLCSPTETRGHGGAGGRTPVHRVRYRQGPADSRCVTQDGMRRLRLEQHRKRPARARTRADGGGRAACPPRPTPHPSGGVRSTEHRAPLLSCPSDAAELGGAGGGDRGKCAGCHRSWAGQRPSSDC